MDPNVLLPFASSTLSLVFFVLLIDQWRERRRPYQAVWALGMLWYGLSAGTEWIGGAVGWSEPLYRVWYLIGAIWEAGWLGLGTVYLLGRTRFGFAFALSLFLAGLFTYLTQSRYHYEGSGSAPVLYFLVARRGRAEELQREGAKSRGRLVSAAAGPALAVVSPIPEQRSVS